MDTSLLKPEFDGGVFSNRRWYVAGLGRFWFTSKEDAEEAIKLAGAVAIAEAAELRERVIAALP